MCKERIAGDAELQKDLAVMAGEWRSAVIAETGRERYDELSANLGGDLAYAFVEYRMEQLMIDKLVKDRMPKSSAEYIMQKAVQNTLFGLASSLEQSPLAAEIERRGEAAYRPSKLEKGTGWAIGAAADTLLLGGAGSWGSFARFVGADLAINAIVSRMEKKNTSLSVEDCISKGVFGSDGNVFEDFRKEAGSIRKDKNEYVIATNGLLSKKIAIPTFYFPEWMAGHSPMAAFTGDTRTVWDVERWQEDPTATEPRQKEIRPKEMKADHTEEDGELEDALNPSEKASANVETASREESATTQERPAVADAAPDNEARDGNRQANGNGWDGLLSAMGLSGLGAVGKNLGYVVSMLPDILVGMFTGKTKSLNIDDNLLPMASILAGIFIKNPVLKMLMIGLGGTNLLNKAGHEALGLQREGTRNKETAEAVRYRVYPDEALNPRISNPVLQGGSLIAVMDKVPCTIQLPQKVVDAYNAGALPLNTLANAILTKSDLTQQMAARNYEDNGREEVIKARGIQ
ncbi:MAG: hypothetical protein LUC18_03550 [Porphyromonadaceae bacterium]|nr:hypothetical protein [Porphyromonadaceae bacterium]